MRPVASGEFPIRPGRMRSAQPSLPADLRQRELDDVKERVESLIIEQRLGILRTIGRLLWFAGLPLILTIAAFGFSTQKSNPWFDIEVLGLLVSAIGASYERLSYSVRGPMVAAGIALSSIAALFHLGPLLGIGFLYVTSILVATMVLRPLYAYLVAGILWGATLAQVVSSYLELGLFGRAEVQLGVEQWLRLSLTTLLAAFALVYLFSKIQRSLWDAVEGQMVLRASEKRLVEEREKVLRAASSAQRLESLGRLAGGIAHDFNNSLVVIQCGLESLADDLDREERRALLSELNDGVERAAGTARQLLSFAKRNVEEIGTCSPAEVVERIDSDSRRLLPAHIKLEVRIEESPRLALSALALEQLLLLFVQNAREALGQDAGTVILSVGRDGDGARIEVFDSGPGMDREVLEKACEPFFSTRGEHKAGLGLSTAWSIVHRQGGDLTIESEPGRGTRIVMSFPAAPPESQPETAFPRERPTRGASNQERTVLVLEDEPPVRTAFRRILKHAGLKVVEAGTVAEARAACDSRRFSLLISDGVLPDGGVGEFIRDFRSRQKAPVILCSGYLEEDLALEGIARGQCSFLPKPFSATDLTALVDELLEDSARARG